ncbi:MAG: NHLP-related RiPP peptide [Dokdonella sp.]
MADTNLTQDQARALLEKLARDDNFRTLFETTPARALHALGVDAETIVHLPAACLCTKELAPKSHYEGLLGTVVDDALTSTMMMRPPQIGFTKR